MRILFLNWRCRSNPRAGGAEVVTHRLGEYLVRSGHQVTLFTAAFPGAPHSEEMGGVRVLRRGGQRSVHLHAALWYRRHRAEFDLVVDEVNTVPFFAPLLATVPVVAFFHQLAREVWWYEAPPGLSHLGYFLEPLSLWPYRAVPLLTVSPSSLESLRAAGLEGPACVVPEAVDLEPAASLPPRACAPATLDLVSLGRVVPSKRLEHAIEAVALLVRKRLPARLAVIGRATPSYQDRLARLAARLGIGDRITFHGAIDDDEKRRLLAGAFALLGTSVREGWGLMVTEANAVGVPAVVYDVPGLRDSTRHGETGMLCEAGSPGDLARGVETLWRDPALYHRVRERAWLEAKDRSWDDAGRTVEAFFQAVAGRAC